MSRPRPILFQITKTTKTGAGQGLWGVQFPLPPITAFTPAVLSLGVTLLKPAIQAVMSGITAVVLFSLGWIWYYVTFGWRWYVHKLEYRRREFFTWRYRMTAIMIFAIVYFFVLRKFVHK
jgi:hypothetical protein